MTEIWPPAVVNQDSARGTGQIPDKEDQMYVVTRDDLYLVPTAEVPVTNIHRDEIIEAARLPIRYVAYSPSFRREAGAAGKDTRGILRVHQFDKVEMVYLYGRGFCHRNRTHDGVCGGCAADARPGLSDAPALHARHGLTQERHMTSRSGRRACRSGSRCHRCRTSVTSRHAG